MPRSQSLQEFLGLEAGDFKVLLIAASVLVALLVLASVDYFLRLPKGNSILILGPMGSGKTTLFLQLRDGTKHNGTVTSMQATAESCQLAIEKGTKAKAIQLIDIPGHPRVRHKFEEYTDRTRGIVFVVDAAEFLTQKTLIAEQLYEVLAHQKIARRRPRILLACNKADLGAKAHTVDFIRKRIEKEIEQLRSTRQTLGDATSGDNLLGAHAAGDVFSFQALSKARGILVSTASISAADGNIGEVAAFLRSCVPR